MKKKTARKVIAIMTLLCIAFTSIPMLAGSLEASAASPSVIRTLKATAKSKSSVTLKWNKLTKEQQRKISGFVVLRNGKIVKKLKKNVSSYTDKGLKSGKTYKYQVKTYKKKKIKQWYNTSTGKWQKTKPKKKYRGGTRMATTYKYANASPKKKVVTKKASKAASGSNTSKDGTSDDTSASTGGTDSTTTTKIPAGAKLYREVPSSYKDTYAGVRIHVGQDFSEVSSALKSKANGYETIDRGTWTIYLYNTVNYIDFLAIYVDGNQIKRWITNSAVFGTTEGVELRREDSLDNNSYQHICAAFPLPKANMGGAIMAGLSVSIDDYLYDDEVYAFRTTYDIQQEKRLALHMINAARVANGRGTLVRSKYLEGADLKTGKPLTWSGTITDMWDESKTITCTNQRYGAQAWAETMSNNGVCSHFLSDMSKGKGPITMPYRDEVQYRACKEETGFWLYNAGENCCGGGTGESSLYGYCTSPMHIIQLMDPNHKSIGIGISENFNCEQYCDDIAP